MNLEELIQNYNVKLVALRNKRRFTSKDKGYAYIDRDGIIMIPREWRKFQEQIEGFGVLNQYINDLGYYLCCLDVDTKDFPITKVLSDYPSSIVETKHGYHIYYLSTDPIRLKQLIGNEKELCPVDLRGQRDPSQCKEGSYTKLYGESYGDLNIVDFNEVVSFVYGLFGITPRKRGDYSDNVKEYHLQRTSNIKLPKDALFLAYYLYYQKNDWSTGYPDAFPWGIQLAGQYEIKILQRIAEKLMVISSYKAPRKWVRAFCTGVATGEKGYPYFGKEDLKPEMRVFLAKRFNELNENEIQELAKLLKDVKLYQIMELIQ